MPDQRRLILHIGAPKCGSSALQTALSLTPDLRDGNNVAHRYVVFRPGHGKGTIVSGRAVHRLTRFSPYGYLSWPSLTAQQTLEPLWTAIETTVAVGQRKGHVPILSSESWINHSADFAPRIEVMARNAPLITDVVAFVRPPLDWLNAAYWQWGVWSGLDFDTWVTRPQTRYRLGACLAGWARIGSVRLTVRPTTTDVVLNFADRFQLDLGGGQISNTSAPPALIGFLLRNRRFRPDGHSAKVEFIFQRWCKLPSAGRLWAIRPRHLRLIRADAMADVDRLIAAIPPPDAETLLSDPRWQGFEPYADQIVAAMPPLEDRTGLADLFAALVDGAARAARAARKRHPPVPPCPAATADIATWDKALTEVLVALVDLDEAARLGRLHPILSRTRRKWGATADAGPVGGVEIASPTVQPFADLPDITALAGFGPAETALSAAFGGKLRFDGPVAVFNLPLLILTHSGQSGVVALRDHLLATGVIAGGAASLAAADIATCQIKDRVASLPDYLSRQVARRPAGVRAFCLLADAAQLAIVLRANLHRMFADCHIVHISRGDPIEQAAALHRAQQILAASAVGPVTDFVPIYDRNRIAAILRQQQQETAQIQVLAAAFHQPVLRVLTEDIAADPRQTLHRVLRLMNIDPATATLPSDPAPRPTDPTQAAFSDRFRADIQTLLGLP